MNKTLRKAIFLDRDGVINEEIGNYVTSPAEFNILPHVVPNLRSLASAGFRLIVITNQGGIAKGLYDHQGLAAIHDKLISALARHNITLDDIYYCPHHPDYGSCLCRKPGSLMIAKAAAKHGIDAERSFMIGDAERDMEAAKGAGVVGFRITANEDWTPAAQEILRKTGQ